MVRAVHPSPERFTHRKLLHVAWILWYGRSNHRSPAVYPSKFSQKWFPPLFKFWLDFYVDQLSGLAATSSNLAASPPVFFPAISLRVPIELPDSFGKSPSELRRDPTASSELGPKPRLYLGPSSGCNFIDPTIVRLARC
ncbi:hypothetical protein GW17_00052909 [Ensete ventricosum]|nr:hypothetical protein GW17_00052909 [Ensete ventricosum]